jgi:hypothetical protein
MPGDPRECRKRAARCAQLAVETHNEQLKARLLELSRTWESLANELEQTRPLMAGVDNDARDDAA